MGDVFAVTAGVFRAVEWTVLSVVGDEAISDLFAFEIELSAPRDEIDVAMLTSSAGTFEAELMSRPVMLQLGGPGKMERFGIIATAVMEPMLLSSDAPERMHARVRMVPRAWLMTKRKNSRIFQNQYVHQIVSTVLQDHGISHRWQLIHNYPNRIYCTQYQETDLEFVSRLLAEEGIFYYFEHDPDFQAQAAIVPDAPTGWDALVAGVETIIEAVSPTDEENFSTTFPGSGATGPTGPVDVFVFADRAEHYVDIQRPSAMRITDESDGGTADEQRILHYRRIQNVRSQAVELRDYDFRKPMLLLRAQHPQTLPGDRAAALEVYEHHGEYDVPDINSEMAGVVLQQHRATERMAGGETANPHFLAGQCYTVANLSSTPFGDGRHVIVRVHHESFNGESRGGLPTSDFDGLVRGFAAALHHVTSAQQAMPEEAIRRLILDVAAQKPRSIAYMNRFESAPASVPFRPLHHRRVPRNVTETATVVGPADKEIYTDAMGRIKVQFHWDREGQYNHRSSCWIRCASAWSGAGFGFQFIPRIGMEVVIGFLAGDPDRPVVLGTLYNGTHPTPEPLPERATRSGIRTQSSPHGGGSNELMFDDATGTERIYLHAQKDFETHVGDSQVVSVKNNQRVVISGEQQNNVGTHQSIMVGGHQSEIVGKSQTLSVQQQRSVRVVGGQTHWIGGDVSLDVKGSAVHQFHTHLSSMVAGDQNATVRGNFIAQVGGRFSPDTATDKSNAIVYVQGNAYVTATHQMVFRAETPDNKADTSSIRLEVGDSVLEVLKDRVRITAQTVELKGSDCIVLNGGGAMLKLDGSFRGSGGPVVLEDSKGAVLKLDGGKADLIGSSGVTIKGSSIRLVTGSTSSGAGANNDPANNPTQTPNLKLDFTHGYEGDRNPGEGREAEKTLPIANAKYRIVADDLVYEGSTDSSGHVEVYVPTTTKVVTATVWAQNIYDSTDTSRLEWLIHLEEQLVAQTDETKMSETDKLVVARYRLRNLGYTPGSDLRAIDPLDQDPQTRNAVLAFQFDRNLDPTGMLDDETTERLRNVYTAEILKSGPSGGGGTT